MVHSFNSLTTHNLHVRNGVTKGVLSQQTYVIQLTPAISGQIENDSYCSCLSA